VVDFLHEMKHRITKPITGNIFSIELLNCVLDNKYNSE